MQSPTVRDRQTAPLPADVKQLLEKWPYISLRDLNWHIRQAMGIHDHADSYLVLLVRTISGWNPPTQLVNTVAACALTISIGLSVALNVKDWRAGERRFAVHPKEN